jgi:hypothetical protein
MGKRIALISVWALSLIIVGVIAHAQTPAQRGTTPFLEVISDSASNVNTVTM